MNDFVIVEQGAHDGQFALMFSNLCNHALPEFFEALDYRILESFPILEERQSRMLEPFERKLMARLT